MPAAATQPTEVCPGCGAVLIASAEDLPRPGASAACARLFEVTLHGLREQALTDPAAAAAARAADAAYDAQHPGGAEGRLRAALDRLGVADDVDPAVAQRPRAWRTTIADVAADLDVIDLPVLVESWAGAVAADWISATAARP